MFDIEENLKKLPDSPGVYIHKDSLGQIIYVGKAVSLKNRVRQYFRSSTGMDAKTKTMISHISEFEYIKCGTEMEALILECNLIKKHMPKYNVVLRDDKTYPYIKVTVKEEYPRVIKTRIVEKDGAKYFGPYSDVAAVNAAMELLHEIFMLKCCGAKKFPKSHKPCLNNHIGRCRGVCTDPSGKNEYACDIGRILEFLSGKSGGVIDFLKAEMGKAAGEMNFERAAKYRDYIESVKAIGEKQRVTLLGMADTDIVLVVKSGLSCSGVLFSVRGGKLSERETFFLHGGEKEDDSEITAAFIKQYYDSASMIPKEIIVASDLPDSELIEQYLSDLAGRVVKIKAPKRGDKKALLDLAKSDADEMKKSISEKDKASRERKHALGKEIYKILSFGADDYDGKEYRIEAYDISNTNGIDTVGGMVVFEGTRPVRKDYRRFRMRAAERGDDCGAFREVISRRFKRAIAGDPGFSKTPDIVLVDGGKSQASAVEKTLLGLEIDIPVMGMVKNESHKSRGLLYKGEETPLKGNPALYSYIGTIQEEVHRFAIDYHRGVRDKKMRISELDNIPGIGPARRNALLSYFGSIEKIREAEVEELCKADGVTLTAAKSVLEYFSK